MSVMPKRATWPPWAPTLLACLMVGPCSLIKGLIFPCSKATPSPPNPELRLLWAQHGCACEGNHTRERNLYFLRGPRLAGDECSLKSRRTLAKPSSALVGKADKGGGLEPPKEFMPMPGRIPGTGFQRARLTEMRPGNSRSNRASTPLVDGLDGWLQTIRSCCVRFARDCGHAQASSLFLSLLICKIRAYC